MKWYKVNSPIKELINPEINSEFISGNYFLISNKECSLLEVFNSISYIDNRQFNSNRNFFENEIDKIENSIIPLQNNLLFTIISPEYFYGPIPNCDYDSISQVRTLVGNIVLKNPSEDHIESLITSILECSVYKLNEVLVYTLSICYLCKGKYTALDELLNNFISSNKEFINWKEKFMFLKGLNLHLSKKNEELDYSILFSDKKEDFFAFFSSKNKYFNSLEDFTNESKSKNKIVVGHGDFNSPRILIKRKSNDLNLDLVDLHEIFASVFNHTNLFSVIACYSEDFYPKIPINTSVIYFVKTIQPRTVLFTCNYIIDFYNRNFTNEQIYLILREILFTFTNDSENIRYVK